MPKTLLNKINFTSYKKFAGTEFLEIRPVTILVGKNSSGKSSITKLFPMLRCSLSDFSLKGPLSYKNDDVELSSSFQGLSHNGYSTGLAFGINLTNGINIQVELVAGKKGELIASVYNLTWKGKTYTLKLKSNQETYACLEPLKEYKVSDLSGFIHRELFKDLELSTDFPQDIDYIGPLRKMPERTLTSNGTDKYNYVGKDGINAYSMLYWDDTLIKKVSLWFEENFDSKVNIKSLTEPNSYQILFNKPYMGEYEVNIVDEGMGIGQVFPIIVRCLNKIEGSIIAIEQPELHLHPAAHESLAKLFATTSKENNHSYIVETHSANLLLGIQEAVVDSNIDFSSDDVIIYFVDEDESGSYLKQINIDENGMLDDWPEGVFNESYEIISRINRKHKKL